LGLPNVVWAPLLVATLTNTKEALHSYSKSRKGWEAGLKPEQQDFLCPEVKIMVMMMVI
jgi:hypothetical protein